ncbi:50S ribosomal protein L3 [Candidatus Wirthbacteria bacterium CG2_30_54_11]|uniref:Large ribosomal subunit protein uL3 n=1 Tax=Candidatus Wirthbacteria bacterium CG2_30_54_11 TaxID=1817892 RepID=A0A1J5ITJ9_9BACT|nr:ribosomal protein L3 [uncultured bacterium]OIQ00558.1 MAG: 50S ribosomal protein L3 [Candidatus Wirthbacteria bacterium CG2_30_54_11]
MKAILAKKIGVAQIFDEKGSALAVTALEVNPCEVTAIRQSPKETYNAIQLGVGRCKKNKAGASFKLLREIRTDDAASFAVGQQLTCDIFQEGEHVDVQGSSKGKGFAGFIKRHNFSRGPMGHGHDHHRAPGSIGASAYPGRVIKGKRMAGHMGDEKKTVQNLLIAKILLKDNVILVHGSVPGGRGSVVLIKSSTKN